MTSHKKYIILSFDDGRLDFYKKVFPVLKKYNCKATLNVVTGYMDTSIEAPYDVCSSKMIKEMSDSDLVEIALHGDRHLRLETPLDYDVCLKKINSLLCGKKICCSAMPFNQKPSKSLIKWHKKNSINIIRRGMVPTEKSIKLIIGKIIHKDFEFSEKAAVIISKNGKPKKTNKKIRFFYAIPIENERKPSEYLHIIDSMKNDQIAVFMFHSVFDDNNRETVHFLKGAWSISKFEQFIEKITRNETVEVVFQRDV